jgi:hypothetical protein
MPTNLKDPAEDGRAIAEQINGDRHQFITGPVERVLADAPFVDPDELLSGLAAFHSERMARIPSATRYPEAVQWAEYAIAVQKEVQAVAGLTDVELAAYSSLIHYLMFRGYMNAGPRMTEKCRVVYLPETDRGALHMKNVDDPITFWKPEADPGKGAAISAGLHWDGAGSGLHIDDEPDEIFPLPVYEMCRDLCDDVPGAVEFLTRYSSFWGGQNIVLFDDEKRSVAIEKGSYNFIDVFEPDASGGSHCSGMAFRQPQTAQGEHARDKRQQFLQRFAQPADGPDMTYWDTCDRAEEMLASLMAQDSVTVQEVFDLLTTPWPDGLNKPGTKLHPDQGLGEYTLKTNAVLRDERKVYLWQRDIDGVYPDEPHIVDLA